MKIICVDNFDRELYPDVLIAEGITNKVLGEFMVESLNNKYSGAQSSQFYKLVPDDYVLFTRDY